MAAIHDPTQLFVNSEQASAFCRFRPYYGDDLYQRILKYHKPKNDHSNMNLALDLGCGPGQSTVPLARFFNKVLGVDVSPVMIAKANKAIRNVTFKVGNAEALGDLVESGSVDLVTLGQAFHWIDKDRLFAEVKRVLKPGGTIAVYNYEDRYLTNPEADIIMREFETKLEDYRKKSLDNVEEKYDPERFPFHDVQLVDDFPMERDYTSNALRGYLRSLSYVQLYFNDYPQSPILDDLMDRLEPFFKSPDGIEQRLKMKWKFLLILGRHKGT